MLKKGMVELPLYGGPLHGETIEIMAENLVIRPFISIDDGNGGYYEYKYTTDDKFEFVDDSNRHDPKFRATGFLFDDDGNVLAEVDSPEEALDTLDLLEKAEKIKDEAE